MNGKELFALTRIGAAIIAASIVLACSGWAFLFYFKSPQPIEQGAELTRDAYVTADMEFLMDICGVERTRGGSAKAYYAIAPIGDQFVLVRFPASDYDALAEFESATQAYLAGTQRNLPFHMTVTGMSAEPGETAAALLSSWFSDNVGWMERSGLIAEVDDHSVYLCPYMIDTGSVGTVGTTAAAVMTAVSAALLLWAAVEIVILCRGRRGGGGPSHG